MSYFKINSKNGLGYLPKIKNISDIRDYEQAFEEWIDEKLPGIRPTGQNIYIFKNCMRPWFNELHNREDVHKGKLEKDYGEWLRITMMSTIKTEMYTRDSLDDSTKLLSTIKFIFNILPTSWFAAKSDMIFIKFGKLMGANNKQLAEQLLSKKVKFSSKGEIVNQNE